MQYQKKRVNGDAGEYFVAYRFTRLFGWPYRQLDVDIGVDAEVEILGEENRSTGNIIKIQIKSAETTADGVKSVHVDPRHIEYWKRFCVPIVVCCVDLAAEKIYWKNITSNEAYRSAGKSGKIVFDPVQDELTGASKARLEKLVTPDESKEIEPLFDQLHKQHKSLVLRGDMFCIEGDELDRIGEEVDAIRKTIAVIRTLILHFPWRVSKFDLGLLESIEIDTNRRWNDANHSYTSGVEGM